MSGRELNAAGMPIKSSVGANAAYYIGADQSPSGLAAAADLKALRHEHAEMLDMLRDVSDEITSVNTNCGQTVFNPAVTGALRALIAKAEGPK